MAKKERPVGEHVYHGHFAYGDKVTLDGDKDIVATVLSVQFRGENVTYHVSWFSNGHMVEPWIEEWRLEKWEG